MTSTPRIAVMGCKPTMPDAFPTEMRENAGNMIHGSAPFEMFRDVVFYEDRRFTDGRGDFRSYVENECTHLIVTTANTLRVGNPDPVRYIRLLSFLKSYEDVPVVIFGLGAQSARKEFPADGFPPEAIELMKYMGDRMPAISVRGEYTAAVFEHYAGVTNTFVTGCPSFFSRPAAFDQLADSLATNRAGRVSYSGTNYRDPSEQAMLVRAIREDTHLVESSSPILARYANVLQRGVKRPGLPDFLKPAVDAGDLTRIQIEKYFASRFQLFRQTSAWYKFNQDCVGFAVGTRFHASMAALLSGVPALWVTHDSRTQEFTDYLKLPAIAKDEAAALDFAELRDRIDYAPMFQALPGLFERFNSYLAIHGLPAVEPPEAASRPPAVSRLEPLAAVARPPKPAPPSVPVRLMNRAARAVRRLARPAARP